MPPRITIGVLGGSQVSDDTAAAAYDVGRHIAMNSAVLVCGGLGGVMEAASRGASDNGGLVVGLLPGDTKASANHFVHVALPTGLGVGRNLLVVRASDVLIAFPGSYGTLSEIALALTHGKTVVYMPGSWDLKRIGRVDSALFKEAHDPGQAVGLALNACA
ncbi:MAG: TIGR00725 family protein [Chitinivibrionales bacterium]|nr:TIGR00725 family protein [Chitinivibrionales bacterium]MBD3394650.1 TIGR00725 family protein [Chitinivibrionales bacterium]